MSTSTPQHHPRAQMLFLLLGIFFIGNALLAEFIGAKIFSLEATLGTQPVNLSLFGVDGLAFNMTAGVILWPFVFVLTDLINEYFGRRGVRLLSFIAAGVILYAFFMVYIAIHLTPADFWVRGKVEGADLNNQHAYQAVFGQGLWIIAGSLVAFLIGQLVDVIVFHRFKRWTGPRLVWVRATGSTLVSQLIDSFVVLFIAFYIGANWSLKTVLAIAIVNYLYKFVAALVMTPVLLGVHNVIDRYLGKKLAEELMEEASAAEGYSTQGAAANS